VAAARAALEVVGGPQGRLRAAEIVVEELKHDRSDRDRAWSLAMDVKRKAWAEFDPEALLPLLNGLVAVYPEQLAYRYDRALAHGYMGRVGDAIADYRAIVHNAPSESDAQYRLAFLLEETGDLDGAAGVYDKLVAQEQRDPALLRAHLLKTRLLRSTVRDYAAARRAVDAAVALARELPASTDRDRYLPLFDEERRVIGQAEQDRETLLALRSTLDRVLVGVALAWAAVLGGGVILLRRARWI
jgi:tetratricopeptide (TPR) repeat protein